MNRMDYFLNAVVRTDLNSHYRHHIAPPARIFLPLSHHPSLASIAPGRPSRLHPVSAQRCCI